MYILISLIDGDEMQFRYYSEVMDYLENEGFDITKDDWCNYYRMRRIKL